MPTTTTHPDAKTLAAFARGSLPAAELNAVAEHVASCEGCCAALGRVPDDTLVNLAKQAGHTPEVSLPSFPVPIPDTEPVPAELADHPRYKVLAELGAGGMGVVYKAEHKMMGRLVALKVMAPHLTAKASAVDRFHREVKAAAKLMHPNIVTAHDADSAGGLHFLVMEFVEGVSLDRLVRRRGPLAVTMAAQLARQTALGLQHAHEKDMVHRDIKPQNLMVSRKGQVKILDFGLAKFARDADADGAKAQATAANLLMGTPEYLSPEQAKNSHNVDSRSDIYSLGCTLYFLLTARVPFPDATTLIDKLLAHTQEEPTALRSIRAEVPEGLAAVVAKMMAKSPNDRYATPQDVANALLPFTKEPDPANLAATPHLAVVPVVAALPTPVPTPVAETLNPFALDTEPETTAPIGPKPVVAVAEPRRKKAKRGKAAPAGLSKGLKRLIGAGVAAVALLVVAGLASKKKDKTDPPAVAGGITDGTGSGGDKVTKGGGGAGEKGNATKGGSGSGAVAKKDDRKASDDGAKSANERGGWENRGGVVPPVTTATTKKVLFIVPAAGVWMPDYIPVRDEFARAGVELVVASTQNEASPMGDNPAGEKVPVNVLLRNVTARGPYDGVMLCGGDVKEYMWKGEATQTVRAIVEHFQKADKPVGGLCLGMAVLGATDQIKGRRVATCPQLQKDYAPMHRSLNVQGIGVTKHDNLITASGPEQAKDFAEAMLKAIGAK
jgi:putative intracellular protease/amidase/predicted Ser/Thr protein kinase